MLAHSGQRSLSKMAISHRLQAGHQDSIKPAVLTDSHNALLVLEECKSNIILKFQTSPLTAYADLEWLGPHLPAPFRHRHSALSIAKPQSYLASSRWRLHSQCRELASSHRPRPCTREKQPRHQRQSARTQYRCQGSPSESQRPRSRLSRIHP